MYLMLNQIRFHKPNELMWHRQNGYPEIEQTERQTRRDHTCFNTTQISWASHHLYAQLFQRKVLCSRNLYRNIISHLGRTHCQALHDQKPLLVLLLRTHENGQGSSDLNYTVIVSRQISERNNLQKKRNSIRDGPHLKDHKYACVPWRVHVPTCTLKRGKTVVVYWVQHLWWRLL